MKTILVPVHDDAADEPAIETACLIADRFAGYVEGLLVLQNPHLFVQSTSGRPISVHPETVGQLVREWRQVADKALQRFSGAVSQRRIPITALTVATDGPSAGWYEMEGDESRVVAEYGRVFDLIVIARSGREMPAAWEATCEAALFESGRPVIIAPPERPRKLGETVVIAWNRSTETARTVGLGMPFLAKAARVIVLSVEGWMFPGPSGEDLAAHLVRNGIDATARTVEPHGRSNGETILQEAAALGADLLLKGAYTQTRLRQMIFGGATRHVLSEAKIPVLMAH